MHRRPPSPPQPPRRGRSRSPVAPVENYHQRVQGLLEANRRNLSQRRGGAAAQRCTRAIHKHLLVILINYLGDLLTGTQELSVAYRQERRVRKRLAEERLEYLERGNFPENKWEVLPGLRRVVHSRSDLDLNISDIESCATNDTISVHSSEEECEAEAAPVASGSAASRAAVRITSSNPLLRPKAKPSSSAVAKPKPSSRVIAVQDVQYWRELDASALRNLDLQVFSGRNTNGFAGKGAVISWDHHQVLDVYRQGRAVERATHQNLPQQTQQVLQSVHQGFPSCQFAQVVLSYCHHPTTVENVRRLCSSQPEFVKIYISRKVTGSVGKLSVLRAIFALQHPLIHIDDSPEVVTEIRDFLRRTPECRWKVIQIRCGRKALKVEASHWNLTSLVSP